MTGHDDKNTQEVGEGVSRSLPEDRYVWLPEITPLYTTIVPLGLDSLREAGGRQQNDQFEKEKGDI
jgi:hypothetical protein